MQFPQGAEKAFNFTRLPNFLFEAPTFKPLSNEAKVLYAFILRRTELSRKNGWADEYGRIYLYYPINEAILLLSPSLSYPGFSTGKISQELARIGLEWIEYKSIFLSLYFYIPSGFRTSQE